MQDMRSLVEEAGIEIGREQSAVIVEAQRKRTEDLLVDEFLGEVQDLADMTLRQLLKDYTKFAEKRRKTLNEDPFYKYIVEPQEGRGADFTVDSGYVVGERYQPTDHQTDRVSFVGNFLPSRL